MPVTVGGVTNGVPSVAATVGPGLQPTNEVVGNLPGAGQYGPCGDSYDNLVVDFGFTPTYSIGNRVFADNGASGGTAADGTQNGAEPGIAGVSVQLKSAAGTVLMTTNTDASGYYRFDNLQAGTYSLFLPASNFSGSGALVGLLSSTGTKTGDQGDKGLDDLSPAANGISTGPIIAGPGVPSGETDLASGAGAHGPNGDAYDDLSVDLGMVAATATCSIGSLVWHDANNNGAYDSGETGIAGVTVEVWSCDSSGVLHTRMTTVTTASDGTYAVGGLSPATYRVKIPASNFDMGQPLESRTKSSTSNGNQGTKDDNKDNDDNGAPDPSPRQEVLSPVIALSIGDEAVGTQEPGPGGALDDTAEDANGNMTVDFGFYAPTADQSNLCSLGSLVWNDANNNGAFDSGESGIAGVMLQLYQTNASGLIYWSSTITASNGTYFFDDLPSGSNWVVRIPATNFTGSGALTACNKSSGTPVNADNQTDSDNNALQPGGFGTEAWSPVITLATNAEPTTAETGPGSDQDNAGAYVDANGDMTVDFGFTTTYSLGNKIYRDPDNDGQPDLDNADEGGITNVHLVVFAADGSGNPTGSSLGTATTDSEGFYRFDGLLAGTYVVVVDKANSPSLDLFVSVRGVYSDTAVSGDLYDHGKDTPLGTGSVLPGGIASTPVTLGPGLQPVGEGTAPGQGGNGPTGDANDNLVMDFGFMPLYSLGNRLFLDNGAGTGGVLNDGIQNGDEPGVAGVTVKLFLANGAGEPTGTALTNVTTDADGYYRFDGLIATNYVVVVDKAAAAGLSSYVSSTGASSDNEIGGDLHDHGKDTPLDAASVLPGGIASAPVIMGAELGPLDEAVSGAGAGAHGPNTDDSDNLVVDFGFAPAASAAGSVIVDVNGNGSLEDGETTGINGVTVTLETTNGIPVATNVTATGGTYLFSNLAPGDYVIVETDPSGYASTGDASAPNDNRIPVTLTSGQNASGKYFLDAQPGSIAGTVLEDANRSGGFDVNDTPISGVAVVLQTAGGSPVATNLTSGAGAWLFSGIMPGDYVVVETDPASWTSTADTSAPNDNRIPVTLASGQTSTGNNFLDTPPIHVWSPAGSLTCNVTNAAGTAGAGYGTLNLTGYLDVQATSGSPYAIQLASFDGSAPGFATNWNNGSVYTWTIATTTRGVLNFDASKFTVTTTGFVNDLSGGTFSVTSDGYNVYVVFTPNYPPDAFPVSLGRAWGTSMRISISSLLANGTTDPEGTARILVRAGPGTNGASIGTNSTFILFAPTNNIPESFEYVVRDSCPNYRPGDTVRMSTNWITVIVTNAISSVQSITNSGSGLTMRFAGVPGYAYAVERSTDLTTWTVVQTTNAPPTGIWEYHEATPPEPAAFYRTRQN